MPIGHQNGEEQKGRRIACHTAGMDPAAQTKVDQLAESLTELTEEIDLASDYDASDEEVRGARALAEDVLGRYGELLSGLEGDDKTAVQRSIGLKVAKIEGLLTALRQA